MTSTTQRVVFCTNTNSIIDTVRTAAGETDEIAVQRLTAEYGPDLTVLAANEAHTRYEQQFITPVREITCQDYMEALIILPPKDWIRAHGGESFKCMERIAGKITAIYVVLQGRFFTFNDCTRTPHEECLKRVAGFIAAENSGGRHG